MKIKKTERGWAGHYICSYECLFTRNTLIEYGDKKWIVSTVGNKYVYDTETMDKLQDTIGHNRYYETMAFKSCNDEYDDIDVSRQISFNSNWAINDMENKPDLRANKLHDDVVKELSIKIKEIKL
jgi:hypothetical protein